MENEEFKCRTCKKQYLYPDEGNLIFCRSCAAKTNIESMRKVKELKDLLFVREKKDE